MMGNRWADLTKAEPLPLRPDRWQQPIRSAHDQKNLAQQGVSIDAQEDAGAGWIQRDSPCRPRKIPPCGHWIDGESPVRALDECAIDSHQADRSPADNRYAGAWRYVCVARAKPGGGEGIGHHQSLIGGDPVGNEGGVHVGGTPERLPPAHPPAPWTGHSRCRRHGRSSARCRQDISDRRRSPQPLAS